MGDIKITKKDVMWGSDWFRDNNTSIGITAINTG